MSWQFWLIVHAAIAAVAIALALRDKRWLTAVLMCAGAVTGGVLAVVPLWISMQRFEAETGYGAGNAGVLFCCTVPLFPIIGLGLGALIGTAIRRPHDTDRV